MLLPIIAEKVQQEKVQQEKLKEVKARLNFEGCSGRNSKIQEVSQHFESNTPNRRGEYRRGRRSGRSCSMSGSPERTSIFSRIRCDRSESSRHRPGGKGRRDRGVFNRLGGKGKSVFAHSKIRYQSSRSGRTESIPRKHHHEGTCSRRTEMLSKSEDSGGGHWKSKSKKKKSSIEEETLQRRGAPECTIIFKFMHGITNPELIRRLRDKIPKSVDEMIRVTTTFLKGEVAASNQVRKKTLPTWKQHEAGRKQNFDRKGDFRNQ
ncbi:hypothetical protein Tco_0327523 [Tanacetum coccineum]